MKKERLCKKLTTYLAVFAVVCDWEVLRTIVSDEQIGVIARELAGNLVYLQKGIQMLFANGAALESGLWECRFDGVFTTMTHPEFAQFRSSLIRIGISFTAAHLLNVQFLQIIKALSTVDVLVTVDNFFVVIVIIRWRRRWVWVTRWRTKMNVGRARTRHTTRSTHVGGRQPGVDVMQMLFFFAKKSTIVEVRSRLRGSLVMLTLMSSWRTESCFGRDRRRWAWGRCVGAGHQEQFRWRK